MGASVQGNIKKRVHIEAHVHKHEGAHTQRGACIQRHTLTNVRCTHAQSGVHTSRPACSQLLRYGWESGLACAAAASIGVLKGRAQPDADRQQRPWGGFG